jgi:hypothetical protein
MTQPILQRRLEGEATAKHKALPHDLSLSITSKFSFGFKYYTVLAASLPLPSFHAVRIIKFGLSGRL